MVVPIDEVRNEWVRLVSAMQAKMLALPSTLAGELSESDSPPEIEDILNSHIREALAELSRTQL